MPDEVTIHAARLDESGRLWLQASENPDLYVHGLNRILLETLEELYGPTRPVRITTTTTPAPLGQFDPPLTDAEKAAFLAADRELNGPAGLSAEQEVRARALDIASRYHDPPADTLELAERFAAWIRDGGVPDA